MATYYIAASGGSDSNPGTYAQPWASLSKAYNTTTGMASGDTLVFKNGTYTTTANIRLLRGATGTRPPHGSSSVGYTTLMAETPGSVIFDYNSTGCPFEMQGSYGGTFGTPTYMKFDGFVFRRMAAFADFFGVNHIKVTRCGFESKTATGNNPTFSWDSSSFCLMEDCFFWGRGRYRVIFYRSDKMIGRRLVGRIDDHDCGGEPIAGFAIYRSTNSEFQNCINIDSDQPSFWRGVGEYGGGFLFPTTDGGVNANNNSHLRGCITLKSAMGFGAFPANQGTVTVTDCVGWDIVGAMYFRNACTINHCTFGVVAGPPWYQRGTANQYQFTGVAKNDGGTVTVKNTAIYNVNGNATLNTVNNNNALWRGATASTPNWATGTLGTGTTTSVDLAAGIDYILRVDDTGLIDHADDGGDIGANILKRIGTSESLWGDSGYNTTTSEDLWPWPYEDIISANMQTYSATVSGVGTISGNRGFATGTKTLTEYIWEYLGNPSPYGLPTQNSGEVEMLKRLLYSASAENWTLKLYRTDVTPAESDTVSSYTEANFTGYTSKTITNTQSSSTWSVPETGEDGITLSTYQTDFTWTATSAQVIYGYYVVGATSGILLFAEKFATTRNLASGDSLTFTFKFELD